MIIITDKTSPRLMKVEPNYLSRLTEIILKDSIYKKVELALAKFNTKIATLDPKKLSSYHNRIVHTDIINSCQTKGWTATDKKNEEKVHSLIEYANEIYNDQSDIDTSTLFKVHSIISGGRNIGFRPKGVVKVIKNNLLPSGNEIHVSLNNFWDIFYGNDDYKDINVLVRYCYQQLYFLLIRPFEFGNAVCSRFISLFFFKEQEDENINNQFFNISSYLYKSEKEYKQLVQNCIIPVNNELELSGDVFKKSLNADAKFVSFILHKLEECLNFIISKVPVK